MIAITDLLHRRSATRAFAFEPVDDEAIADLIDAARLTPSCYNKQPWRFMFLETPEARAWGCEVLAEGNRAWASHAPLLVIAYARRDDDCVLPDGRAYFAFDTGMAVMSLILAATELDLVARPMAGFDPDKLRARFQLDPADEPLVMLAIGYPSSDDAHVPEAYKGNRPRSRKSADEVVRRL